MNKRKVYPIYLAFGALILYGALYLVPGLMGIGYSFTDWSSYSREISFVGLENFKKIFSSDNGYLAYILNTIKFTVFTTILKTIIGLAFALILVKQIVGRDFYRAVFFLPAVLPLVITGLVFKSIFNPASGLLNSFLSSVRLDFLTRKWLVDPSTAFGSIIAVDIWRGAGYIMCIMIAGLQSISPTYYEVAKIDGAGAFQRLLHVTLPLMIPTLMVTTVLNMLYGLKIFDLVFVLTNGGPGRLTEVLYTSVFREFSQGKYALSTAMSSLMFVVMIGVGYFVIRMMTAEEARR